MYKEHKQYRLKGYDYSGQGEYFITICTKNHISHFGRIINDTMELNESGKIAEKFWKEIHDTIENTVLDVFQIMPDHLHGIIIIKPDNQKNQTYQKNPKLNSGIKNNPMELNKITIGRIIRWFKGRTKFEIEKSNYWFQRQSRFHVRIIRDDKEFYFITEYIVNNPSNWKKGILKGYFESLKSP